MKKWMYANVVLWLYFLWACGTATYAQSNRVLIDPFRGAVRTYVPFHVPIKVVGPINDSTTGVMLEVYKRKAGTTTEGLWITKNRLTEKPKEADGLRKTPCGNPVDLTYYDKIQGPFTWSRFSISDPACTGDTCRKYFEIGIDELEPNENYSFVLTYYQEPGPSKLAAFRTNFTNLYYDAVTAKFKADLKAGKNICENISAENLVKLDQSLQDKLQEGYCGCLDLRKCGTPITKIKDSKDDKIEVYPPIFQEALNQLITDKAFDNLCPVLGDMEAVYKKDQSLTDAFRDKGKIIDQLNADKAKSLLNSLAKGAATGIYTTEIIGIAQKLSLAVLGDNRDNQLTLFYGHLSLLDFKDNKPAYSQLQDNSRGMDLNGKSVNLGITVDEIRKLELFLGQLQQPANSALCVTIVSPGGSSPAANTARINKVSTLKNALIKLRENLQENRNNLDRLIQDQKKILVQIDNIGKGLTVAVKEVVDVPTKVSYDYYTRAKWYMSADVGLAYMPSEGLIRPYFGTNIYFAPVNKNAPLSTRRGKQQWGYRVSALAGLTFGKIEDDTRDELFPSAGMNLLLGGGLRVTDQLRLNVGGVLFQQKNKNPLITDKHLAITPFVSFSFDVNVSSFVNFLLPSSLRPTYYEIK